MSKIIYGALAALFVVVEICMIVMGMAKDKKPPVINIYQEKINYSFGCDDEVLLAGAVATDGKDGDVTKLVTVSARVEMVQGKLESVTYSASDKAGNVSSMKVLFVTESNGTYKILPFENYHVNSENLQYSIEGAELAGYIEQAQVIAPSQNLEQTTSEEETTTEDATTTADEETTGDEGVSEGETTTKPEEKTTKDSVDAGNETATKQTGYTGTDGKPQIVLAKTEETIKVGGKVNWVKFVDEVYDDVDDRDTLFKRIGITKTLEFTAPGDYEQGLYVTDMDGNKSKTMTVIVHVVE